MSKKMYADESKVVIYEGADDVVDNPMGRLGDVYFHSDLSYMEVVQSPSYNITIPAVNQQPQQETINIHSHNLGYIPLVTAYIVDLQIFMTGTVVLEMEEGDTFALRTLNISADTSNIYLLHFGDYFEFNLPELNYEFKLFLFSEI